MLRSFRVENHRSIRDEQELALLPAYDKSRPVVPVAAIFGANASGKSNLLDALRWLREAVLNSFASWQPGSGVPRTPFRLDPEVEHQPSGYSVDLALDGARYTYGLIVDDERVCEEWLYTYPHNRRRIIFEREADSIRLGSTLPDYRSRSEVLASLTRPNALLLSVAARSNLTETQAVYDWFRSGLDLMTEERSRPLGSLLRRLEPGAPNRAGIVELVRTADLGITDIELMDQVDEKDVEYLQLRLDDALARHRELEASVDRLYVSLRSGEDEAERMALEAELASFRARLADVMRDEQQTSVRLRVALSAREQPPTLVFRHGPHASWFELADESAGTRTWLSLLSAALDVIDAGSLLIVDELDMSLHPLLAAPLVNLFRDHRVNTLGAQLIFTTHDTTLLDEEIVARDEIWFVEKKPDTGATKLYPLTDFHPRKSENIEGRYLAGGYGGIPLVSEHSFLQAVRRLRGDHEAA